jgi:hypothetical protein
MSPVEVSISIGTAVVAFGVDIPLSSATTAQQPLSLAESRILHFDHFGRVTPKAYVLMWLLAILHDASQNHDAIHINAAKISLAKLVRQGLPVVFVWYLHLASWLSHLK